MNKLTRKDADRLDTLRDAFTTTWEALDSAVSAHTDADGDEGIAIDTVDAMGAVQPAPESKATLRAAVDVAFAAYVTAHNDLREFCSDLRGAMGDYFEGKSEGWQEGARGERYHAWMDKFEAVAESATPELDVTEDGCVDMPEDIASEVDELSSEQDD
jgi:hypothetical protein